MNLCHGLVTSYFNCIEWSDFGHEAEMLFIAGFNHIVISGVYAMIENHKYVHGEWTKIWKHFKLLLSMDMDH